MTDIHDQHNAVVSILALFFVLGIGSVCRILLRNIPVPYTVILLLFGAMVGGCVRKGWNDALSQSFEILIELEPHLLLHIFLPALIFESAFNMDWHVFNKVKYNCLYLAGPGLLASTFALGWVVNTLLIPHSAQNFDLCHGAGWGNSSGYLLGVILSATDPVAVVALFKDLGVKADLSTFIEGESLLNDGTALVVYTVLITAVEGAFEYNAAQILWIFLRMSLGGVVFGVLMGLLLVLFLGIVFNDAMVEITMTLVFAYLTFFIAEQFLSVSGVLAVVALGLYMGRSGKTTVSPEVLHFLQEFWEMLAFFGNTLIFVIAGLVISHELPSHLLSDGWMVVVVYVAAHLIRGLMAATVWVGNTKIMHHPCLAKDMVVGVWGGLRGAVGLALALMVYRNTSVCLAVRERILFHTSAIVVLTVVFNGTSMRWLLIWLGYDKVHKAHLLAFNQAIRSLRQSEKRQEEKLREDHTFDSANWTTVRQYYFEVPKMNVARESSNPMDKRSRYRVNILNSFASCRRKTGLGTGIELKEARRRLLMVCRRSYLNQFEDGLISENAVKVMLDTTDNAIDKDSIDEWKTVCSLLTTHPNSGVIVVGGNVSKLKFLKWLDGPTMFFLNMGIIIGLIVMRSLRKHIIFSTYQVLFTSLLSCEIATRVYCYNGFLAFMTSPFNVIDTFVLIMNIIQVEVDSDHIDPKPPVFWIVIQVITFLRVLRLIEIYPRFLCKRNYSRRKNMSFSFEAGFELMRKPSGFMDRFRKRIIYQNLILAFEVAVGFKIAREEALDLLDDFFKEDERFLHIKMQARADIKQVQAALLDIERMFSEIAASITTVVAARSVLNVQRSQLYRLKHEGLLDVMETEKMQGQIELQMARLLFHPPLFGLPTKEKMLKKVRWLETVDENTFEDIKQNSTEMMVQKDTIIIRQGENDDSVYVVARGTVAIFDENQSGRWTKLGEVGMGSVLGEISWCLNLPRTASVKATCPSILFKINGTHLRNLANEDPRLNEKLWEACAPRIAEEILLVDQTGDTHLSRRMIRKEAKKLIFQNVKRHTKFEFINGSEVVLVYGSASVADSAPIVSESIPSLTPRPQPQTARGQTKKMNVNVNKSEEMPSIPVTTRPLYESHEGKPLTADLSQSTTEGDDLRLHCSFKQIQGPVIIRATPTSQGFFTVKFFAGSKFMVNPSDFYIARRESTEVTALESFDFDSMHIDDLTPVYSLTRPVKKLPKSSAAVEPSVFSFDETKQTSILVDNSTPREEIKRFNTKSMVHNFVKIQQCSSSSFKEY